MYRSSDYYYGQNQNRWDTPSQEYPQANFSRMERRTNVVDVPRNPTAYRFFNNKVTNCNEDQGNCQMVRPHPNYHGPVDPELVCRNDQFVDQGNYQMVQTPPNYHVPAGSELVRKNVQFVEKLISDQVYDDNKNAKRGVYEERMDDGYSQRSRRNSEPRKWDTYKV